MTTNNRMTQLIRCVSAAAALALVPCIATAAASTAPRSHGEVGTFALGGNLGLDLAGNGYGAGFRLSGNGYYTVTELAPKLLLDIGGDLGFIYNGCSTNGVSCSLKTFEIVPTARLRYQILPQLSLYADAGLGLAIASASVTIANVSSSASATGGVFRLTGGVLYQIGQRLYLVGEPLGMNFYFYDGSSFHFSILGGVQYRF
jgi:opacity protein-like surface antigen